MPSIRETAQSLALDARHAREENGDPGFKPRVRRREKEEELLWPAFSGYAQRAEQPGLDKAESDSMNRERRKYIEGPKGCKMQREAPRVRKEENDRIKLRGEKGVRKGGL